MKNEEILKENNGKKFDVCLMNPPYGDQSNGGMFLDMQFVEKCNELSDYQIVIHPAVRFVSNTKIGKKNAGDGHLKEILIFDGNKVFNTSSISSRFIGIYSYDNTKKYDEIDVINELNNTKDIIKKDWDSRKKYFESVEHNKGIIELFKKTKDIYDELKKKYNSICNDGHGFIYEENRLQRGKNWCNIIKKDQQLLSRVKAYLKEGKYKFCLYKGSFNHDYDQVQEWKGQDPDKLFKGQICWLTNKENVKNNLKYWMECPLFDLWRRYKFGYGAGVSGCRYGHLPALDFEMNEDKFKKYVDSLNNFTKEEIQILKDNNIHNADKL